MIESSKSIVKKNAGDCIISLRVCFRFGCYKFVTLVNSFLDEAPIAMHMAGVGVVHTIGCRLGISRYFNPIPTRDKYTDLYIFQNYSNLSTFGKFKKLSRPSLYLP